MARSIWQKWIVNSATGLPVAAATVVLKNPVGGAVIDIYAAKTGGSPLASVASNGDGLATLWVDPGTYNIEVTQGISTATLTEVEIGPALRGSDAVFNSMTTQTFLRGNAVEVEAEAGVFTIPTSSGSAFKFEIDDDCEIDFDDLPAGGVQAFYNDITITGGPHAIVLSADFTILRPDSLDLSMAADTRNLYMVATNDGATLFIIPAKTMIPVA